MDSPTISSASTRRTPTVRRIPREVATRERPLNCERCNEQANISFAAALIATPDARNR